MKSKAQLDIGSILSLISKEDALEYYNEQSEELEFVMDEAVIYWDDGEDRFHGYYSHKENGTHYCFKSGATSTHSEGYMPWDYVEKDLKAKSFLNWIENTGVSPDCKRVGVFLERDIYKEGNPQKFLWKKGLPSSVKKFLILEI